jgi:hypothetical protein
MHILFSIAFCGFAGTALTKALLDSVPGTTHDYGIGQSFARRESAQVGETQATRNPLKTCRYFDASDPETLGPVDWVIDVAANPLC